ncbi:MAG: hypothetical protein SFX18_00275 [Pirellulales bacterium]|nr:hypothetical protein [Pirellulales bacterium]
MFEQFELRHLWLFVGLVGAFWIYNRLMAWLGNRARPFSREDYGGTASLSVDELAARKRWLEEAELELRELARELTARLDTKIGVVQQALVQIEEATGRLHGALEKAERWGLLEEAGFLSESATTGAASPQSATGQSYRRVDGGLAQPAAIPLGRVTMPADLEADPRFERVARLARAGWGAAQIARETGQQIGDVELILSLYQPVG